MNTQTLVVEADCFTVNHFYMTMNSVQQWLINAVSAPQVKHLEKFYFDQQLNELFVINENDANVYAVNSIEEKDSSDLHKAVAKLNEKILKIGTDAGIVEIPRMGLKERIAIQVDFIKTIENFKFFDEFLIAINKQVESQTFVLDELLTSNKSAYFFIDYWAEFKTEQIAYFLNDLEDKYEINFHEAHIWDQSAIKRVS